LVTNDHLLRSEHAHGAAACVLVLTALRMPSSVQRLLA
jgi:hypothetical protein